MVIRNEQATDVFFISVYDWPDPFTSSVIVLLTFLIVKLLASVTEGFNLSRSSDVTNLVDFLGCAQPIPNSSV